MEQNDVLMVIDHLTLFYIIKNIYFPPPKKKLISGYAPGWFGIESRRIENQSVAS